LIQGGSLLSPTARQHKKYVPPFPCTFPGCGRSELRERLGQRVEQFRAVIEFDGNGKAAGAR
jgi:hypothetical protein